MYYDTYIPLLYEGYENKCNVFIPLAHWTQKDTMQNQIFLLCTNVRLNIQSNIVRVRSCNCQFFVPPSMGSYPTPLVHSDSDLLSITTNHLAPSAKSIKSASEEI